MKITFQLVAYTEAAGKYTPGAYLNGNEDNFYIDDDLKDDISCSAKPGEIINLSDEGMIMAVADGMGGMNAGEVASEIAVKTVKEYFTTANITIEQSSTYERRREYLEDVIKECDSRIKAAANSNPEYNGMGSTIILAWMAHGEVTISWLGDSRAYRYNPSYGIQALSKDHSYVQELVDKNVITYEQSFDHPQGNIVIRSLGDTLSNPQPESRNYTVGENDLFMLCSDGLSGVLRDRKSIDPATGMMYPEENIEDVIAANYVDINKCREALFEAAERGDWYDNVTVILCKIVSVDISPLKTEQQARTDNSQIISQQDIVTDVASKAEKNPIDAKTNINKSIHLKINGKGVFYVVIAILVIIAAIVGAIFYLMNACKIEQRNNEPNTVKVDTIKSNKTTSTQVSDKNNQSEKDVKSETKPSADKNEKEDAKAKKLKDFMKEQRQNKLKGMASGRASIAITVSEQPDSNIQQKPSI